MTTYDYRSYPIRATDSEVIIGGGWDWNYASGLEVSLEILGKDGWRLIHLLPTGSGSFMAIFEREAAEAIVDCKSDAV